jgi:hypothetical protein
MRYLAMVLLLGIDGGREAWVRPNALVELQAHYTIAV